MRMTMCRVITDHRIPFAVKPSFVLEDKGNNLAIFPYMPVAIAIFLAIVQIDDKAGFTHTKSINTMVNLIFT